jgi:hypothetical protein
MNYYIKSDIMSHNTEFYIPKDDFDWEYYINQNDDIKKSGIMSLESAYKHWIMYGCYENRVVRLVKSGRILHVKLKTGERFLTAPTLQLMPTQSAMQVKQPKKIDLEFKIAIMIHIFDITMFPFFTSHLNRLSSLYEDTCFDIYINVVKEDSPYTGDPSNLQTVVNDHIKRIHNPNIYYFLSENRGGDIGGFLLLSKYVIGLPEKDYKYVLFAHSKTRAQWRKDLCQSIFTIQFENLPRTPNIGIIGCRKWLHTFDPATHVEEYRRFRYHLSDLCEIYGVNCEKSWQFIAGTMFLANIEIIKYIVMHQIDEVYFRLNKPDSVDINWLTIVTEELRKDPRGAGNDLKYRLKYGKSLHPDYMIEHAYERIIGLICNHLGYKLLAQ